MRIPIIILTKERPDQLRDMVDSIEAYTDPRTYRLIICDNASTQPKMQEYLTFLDGRHTVIRNETNLLLEGFNPGLALVDTEYFIISDPDIMLRNTLTQDWIYKLIKIMDEVRAPKVGLALNIKFNIQNERTKRVQKCEGGYWIKKSKATEDPPAFIAPVDTTMCVLKRDSYRFWNDRLVFDKDHGITPEGYLTQDYYNFKKYRHPVIRVAGPFTAEHLGWDVHEKYKEDYEYYKNNCNLTIASTTNWMAKNEA